MDYEKKYKEALERARKELQTCGSTNCDAARQIFRLFPELNESEDERIRKAIHIYLDWLNGRKDYQPKGDYTIRDMIAWLEKQSNKSVNIDIESMVSSYEQRLKSQGQGNLENNPLINMCVSAFRRGVENTLEELNLKKLEKQGEQKPTLDFNADDWYVSKVDGKIHNMTYNPTDKVEPKFKVGDWITDGDYTWKIVEVKPLDYILQSQDGNIVDDTISHVDEEFNLWTIQDAKDGDVLCTYECCEPKIAFILKGTPKKHYALSYHCYYNIMYPHFGSDSEKGCLAPKDEDVKPATKEQRDLLFQKMHEAGYYQQEQDVEWLKSLKQRIGG